jgi:hypothetical protein
MPVRDTAVHDTTGASVKKIAVLAAAAAGGFFFMKKRRSAKADSDLWAEATNTQDLR